MLQARLSRLPAGARAVLCAASIYGGVFWQSSVTALLIEEETTAVETWLPHLVRLELVSRHKESRLPGDVEYGFRHDLLREAAYGLLRDEDRVLGHLLAAQYLEAAGEREALALAEHYQRGGAAESAARWFQRAAEQALDANELQAAQQRAQRALAAGAMGKARGQLHGLLATCAYWLRDDGETRRCAERALDFLSPGSADWYVSAAHLLVSSGRLRDFATVTRWLQIVLAAQPEADAIAALSLCLSRTGFMFMLQGRIDEMKQIAEELARRAADLPESEPVALAQLHHFRSGYSAITGDAASSLHHLEKTIEYFDRAGDQRNALLERSNLACSYIEVGMFARGEQLCRENLVACEQAKARPARTLSLLMLGYGLTFTPAHRTEARRVLQEAIGESHALGNARYESWATTALCRLHHLESRFADAEIQARAAIALMVAMPTFQAWPLGWLVRALVRMGRLEEALRCSEEAMSKLKASGGYIMDVSVPPLAQIEVLQALGRHDAAQEAIRSAKRRLWRRIERIADPTLRAHFLAHPENAQILAFAD